MHFKHALTMSALWKGQPSAKGEIHFCFNVSTIQIKRNTTLTTIKQLKLQESLYLYTIQSFHRLLSIKFRNHTVNDGDQETSGTSFKRLRQCRKQRNQLLTLHLQNLHITERKGKSFQVFSTMQRFPCSCSRNHKKYRPAIVFYPCLL